MATVTDNHGYTEDCPLSFVYDDFLGDVMCFKLMGGTTINIQPDPKELYAMYRWSVILMDRQKRRQRK